MKKANIFRGVWPRYNKLTVFAQSHMSESADLLVLYVSRVKVLIQLCYMRHFQVEQGDLDGAVSMMKEGVEKFGIRFPDR